MKWKIELITADLGNALSGEVEESRMLLESSDRQGVQTFFF